MGSAKLDNVPDRMWQTLAAGNGAWRVPVLASVTPEGHADARVVVVRNVSPARRELVFFTDRRSYKHAQLQAVPDVCLVIHDSDARWQVRLYGEARAKTATAELDAWWQQLGEPQRAHYSAALVEGAVVRGAEKGRENFAAFHVTVDRFHCLWLDDAGNEAAEFNWEDGGWRGHIVRP